MVSKHKTFIPYLVASLLSMMVCDKIAGEKRHESGQTLSEILYSGKLKEVEGYLSRNQINFKKISPDQFLDYCIATTNSKPLADILAKSGFFQAEQKSTHDAISKCLVHAISQNNVHVVRLLLENGANANFIDPVDGSSMLHLAVDDDNLEIAKMLIKAGGNVNQELRRGDDKTSQKPYNKGMIPLCHATTYEMAKLLIDAGSNLELRDAKGLAILHNAAMLQNTQLLKAILDSKKVNIEQKAADGHTALQIAKQNKNHAAVKLITKAMTR